MKIKHLILAFGGASLLAACNLDEYPYGFYSEDNFYKTEADAESAVNYISTTRSITSNIRVRSSSWAT